MVTTVVKRTRIIGLTFQLEAVGEMRDTWVLYPRLPRVARFDVDSPSEESSLRELR